MKIIKTKHGKIILKKNSPKRIVVEFLEWIAIIALIVVIIKLINE